MTRTKAYLAGGSVAFVVLLGLYILRPTPTAGTADHSALPPATSIPRTPNTSAEPGNSVPNSTPSVAATTTLPDLTKTTLQSIFDEALLPSTKPEDRALAVHLSTNCLMYDQFPAPSLQSVSDLTGQSGDLARLTLTRAEQARATVHRFCAGGNATALVDQLVSKGLRPFGPIHKSLISWRGGQRSQEYWQAVTQVLANPNLFPVQFNTWLNKDLEQQLTSTYGLSLGQAIYVQDELYASLVGADENQTLRLTWRCALTAVCTQGVRPTADPELEKANVVAAQLKDAIQKQRWDLLIPR